MLNNKEFFNTKENNIERNIEKTAANPFVIGDIIDGKYIVFKELTHVYDNSFNKYPLTWREEGSDFVLTLDEILEQILKFVNSQEDPYLPFINVNSTSEMSYSMWGVIFKNRFSKDKKWYVHGVTSGLI